MWYIWIMSVLECTLKLFWVNFGVWMIRGSFRRQLGEHFMRSICNMLHFNIKLIFHHRALLSWHRCKSLEKRFRSSLKISTRKFVEVHSSLCTRSFHNGKHTITTAAHTHKLTCMHAIFNNICIISNHFSVENKWYMAELWNESNRTRKKRDISNQFQSVCVCSRARVCVGIL